MGSLRRTRPENLDDLTIQVAIVRPGPIQGGAVNPYIERRQATARRPDLRGPLRPPVARAGPARHARDDHLPGPGDRGRDGVRGLLAGRGGGPAPCDEPQALGRGDRGLPPALRRRGDGALRGRRRRARRAGVDDDRRLLGLRLPQGPRRGVRPARLPVDLAARPLRAGVPVRAARRAADGLLSARRPRPRGPAPRHRDPAAGRQRERGRLHRHGGRRRAAGTGLRAWGPRRRGRRARRRARLRRSVRVPRRPRLPRRRGPACARAACVVGRVRRARGSRDARRNRRRPDRSCVRHSRR